MGHPDGGRKPHDEDYLVVRSKCEIEELDQNPMVVLSNVEPSIILPALLVSPLACEIISQSSSPDRSQSQHDPLPAWYLNAGAMLLVEDEVSPVEDGEDGPNSIHPWHFSRNLGENKAESAQRESEGKGVLDRAFFTVLKEGEGV